MNPADLEKCFELLWSHHIEMGKSTVKERKALLKKLEKAILRFRQPLKEALYQDFRKPREETDLTEILPLVSEIRHVRRNLRGWLAPRRVSTPLPLLGSSSRIKLSSKGVVLIISPWNYPILLTLSPLIGALAGGNCVMIKPSEYTPHTSSVMEQLLVETFPEAEVKLIQGEAETARALLKLPFHHIFFTGSPRIGKQVMKAAADHLSSITLELGGKSPVIVDSSADIDKAARRIAWAKFLNAGQTCVAPDYILAQESIARKLGEKIMDHWQLFTKEQDGERTPYSGLIHERHLERKRELLAELPPHTEVVRLQKNIHSNHPSHPPTLIYQPLEEARLMQEEIFGPLLPLLTYQKLEEVIEWMQRQDRPLVTYLYSRNRKNIRFIEQHTTSGAISINHSVVYLFNPNLPFGGINGSGMGKSHGYFSLREFTNERAEFHQHLPFSVADMLRPPYNDFKRRIIDFSLKYL